MTTETDMNRKRVLRRESLSAGGGEEPKRRRTGSSSGSSGSPYPTNGKEGSSSGSSGSPYPTNGKEGSTTTTKEEKRTTTSSTTTKGEKRTTASQWEGLALSPPLTATLASLQEHFPSPTPVQRAVLPLLLAHKDTVVQAVTGCGKTLAFLLPVLEMVIQKGRNQVPSSTTTTSSSSIPPPPTEEEEEWWKPSQLSTIILTPTRELAKQIHGVLELLTSKLNVSRPEGRKVGGVVVVGGSTPLSEDISNFLEAGRDPSRGGQVLIGTPGRILSLLTLPSPLFNLKEFQCLIMDEADRLLDLGFEPQLREILRLLPKQRRTGLFSATMTEGMKGVVTAGLRNPVRVVVKVQNMEGDILTEQMIPKSLEVGYTLVEGGERLARLVGMLRDLKEGGKVIIFFGTGASVEFFGVLLPLYFPKSSSSKVKFHSLHGKMVPKRRETTYETFMSPPLDLETTQVLLCTDVAARGLDLPDIDLVIQMDPPQDPKVFSHRCGRSGRAGRPGRAVVFLMACEEVYVNFLNVRKVPVVRCQDDLEEGWRGMVGEVNRKLREFVLNDRELIEKGVKAFVSWIRSYTSHQASYIFTLAALNFPEVAKGFGVLRIPKVPELKGVDMSSFEGCDVNVDEIPYKDKQREKQRLTNLTTTPTTPQKSKKKIHAKKVESWSQTKEAKERRVERQGKREKRRVAVSLAKEGGKKEGGGKEGKGDWKERRIEGLKKQSGK